MTSPGRPDTQYVLGIDGGTEAIRAAIYTSDGHPVGFARAPYPTEYPRPGWAQADPRDWWSALALATKQVLAEQGLRPEQIRGISYGCTSSTVVFCDRDAEPVRPALIWMDVRSSEQTRQIVATQHPALKYSGYVNGSAEWMPSKALWVAQNDPASFAAADVVCEYTDWLGYKLTGEWASSINTATIRGYYDRADAGWPVDLFEKVGLGALAGKLERPVLDMGTVLGGLSAVAAEQLGLAAGTPVAVGGADAFVAQIGLGAISPGRVALITGSSHLQLVQSDSPSYGGGLFGAYTDAVVPGQYTLEGGQPSSGSILRWFRDLVTNGSTDEAVRARTYRDLNAAAAALPPGADGVQVLEHWQGSRTPHADSDSRGAIWGLTLSHSAPHIYRAIIESICFGTETIFRALESAGHRVAEITACGGALNSDLWMQIHADVSNRPIGIPRVGEAGSLGAAVLAAVGAGLHADVPSAARSMTAVERYVEPRPEVHEQYLPLLDDYRQAYGRLADLNHRLAERNRIG